MRRFAFAALLVSIVAFTAPAEALKLQMDVTYTDGEIVFGPLTPDLNGQLPVSVLATFVLRGPVNIPGDTSFDTADVITASLVFGDTVWREGDLQSFESSINIGFFEFPFVNSLTYSLAECPPPPDSCRLAANFPLEISGTDDVTGEPFLYRYVTSEQLVTEAPEPSSLALVALGFASLATWRSTGSARAALTPLRRAG